MIRRKTALTVFVFFIAALVPLHASPEHLVVRTFGGMEPLGRLTASGMGSLGADLTMDTGYGFSPGLELYFHLGERVEIGAGCRWQLLRRVYRSGGDSDEQFGFIPVYIAARVFITEMDDFRLYGTAKAGYSFFRTTSAFNGILEASDGGPVQSVSGGIYAAAGIGINYTIKERPKWGLDFSTDAAYAFYGARGTDTNGDTYRFPYQALTVDFGLDWRF